MEFLTGQHHQQIQIGRQGSTCADKKRESLVAIKYALISGVWTVETYYYYYHYYYYYYIYNFLLLIGVLIGVGVSTEGIGRGPTSTIRMTGYSHA